MNLDKSFLPKNVLKIFLIALLTGIVVGSSCALLLKGLSWAKQIRTNFPYILFFLPLAGLVSYLLYRAFGSKVAKGNLLVIQTIKTPQKPIPFAMAPLIFAGTLLTHIFGGSAGREGSAVQMGAALAQKLATILKIDVRYQKWVLLMGLSAGFSACFGTPWAAVLFGLETTGFLKISKFAFGRFSNIYKMLTIFILLVLTSIWANAVCHLWGVQHTNYALDKIAALDFNSLLFCALAGLVFGLGANFFIKLTNICRYCIGFVRPKYLRIVVGGAVVSLTVYAMDWQSYAGLGIDSIVGYLQSPAVGYEFFIKALLTAITLGAGFKGGEVTPLFFMGAALGSSLVSLLPVEFSTLSAVGFVALFAGATKSPWACTAMGVELFGAAVLPFVLVGCFIAHKVSGRGIYHV